MITIKTQGEDYITCPYPATAFITCRRVIPIGNLNTFPVRCPQCGRGL